MINMLFPWAKSNHNSLQKLNTQGFYNSIMLHESNNEGKQNPIKSDCVSLMSSIGGEFIQQLGPVERNLRGLICVEYQFNAQMHF